MKNTNQSETYPVSTGARKSTACTAHEPKPFGHLRSLGFEVIFTQKNVHSIKIIFIHYRLENSSCSRPRKKLYNKHDNNPTMNVMSRFNQTLGNIDLAYFLGTLHFIISQNMEDFIKTAFNENKMVVLQIFLRVLANVRL